MPPAPADLFAYYAELRAHDPVHWHDPSGAWLVTRHADVSALLLDDRLSSRTIGDLLSSASSRQRRDASQLVDFFDSWLVLSDGTTHSELRKLIVPAMSGPRMAAWAEVFDELASSGWGGAANPGAAAPPERPSIEAFARRFAGAAVGAMLGIADDERSDVTAWSGQLLRFMAEPSLAPERVGPATDALGQLRRYALDIARTRIRWHGLPTLLSGAAALPDDAFVALFAQLVAGGADPVAHSLATAACAAVQWRLPIDGDSDRASLIEEALRFDAPFHMAPRIARSTIPIARTFLRAGDRVLLVMASANRDEAVFESPDRFLLRRTRSGPHLSFGRGRHRCLGPVIARLELDRALRALSGAAPPTAARVPSTATELRFEPPGLL